MRRARLVLKGPQEHKACRALQGLKVLKGPLVPRVLQAHKVYRVLLVRRAAQECKVRRVRRDPKEPQGLKGYKEQ